MKQIQNTVPQSQHHARACRPPAAQIRRLVHRSGAKSRRASKATRRDEASAEAGGARGRQKSARVRAWRRNRNRFHTLPCGRGQSIGWWWCSRAPRGCRVPRLPACLPARAGSPRGPGGRKEARRAGGGAVGCVGRGGSWGCRGPAGFYPRRAPLLFITMAGHRQRPRPPASPLSSRRVASASACLPACLPAALGAPPPFRPPFNRSQLVIGDAKALAFHPLLLFFSLFPYGDARDWQVVVRAIAGGKGSKELAFGWLAIVA